MSIPNSMTRAGIFGPSLSGKTTLAKFISREYWRKMNIKSIILDPHEETWGEQAVVFTNEEKFWETVWASKNCLVIVEEAASTIRREKGLIAVFTRLRHLNHKLLVVGHSGTDLLPVMRQQIDTLYLFRQSRKAADIWSENFADEDLLGAQTLMQYEFFEKVAFVKVRKVKLTESQASGAEKPK